MAIRTIAPFLAYEADGGGTGVPLLAKGTPGTVLVAAADTTQTSIVATAYRLSDGTEFTPMANHHGAVEGFRVDIPDESPGIWFVSGPVASYRPTVEGSRGERGLPGVNGVETDVAMGEYMATPGTNLNAETRVLVGDVLNGALDTMGATLFEAGKKTRAAADELYSNTVSVRHFGAKGDGVTDDTAACQAALDTRGRILFPPGTYRLTAELIIRANTTIEAYGATLLRDHDRGVILRNYTAEDVFYGYAGNNNITILGGVFDCNGGVRKVSRPGCIYLAHSQNITIRDATLKDVFSGHAIELTGTNNVTIDSCKFLGFFTNSPATEYYIEAIQVELCNAVGFTGLSNDYTPTHNLKVNNCQFGNSDTPGAMPWPCAVGSHGAGSGIQYAGMRITNNTIKGASYWGIRLFKWSESVISGNLIIDGAGGGIYATLPGTGSASSVDVNGAPRPAEPSWDNVISGNVIARMGGAGIRVEGQSDAQITGQVVTNNTLRSLGAGALVLVNAVDSQVAHNTIETVTGRCVSITDCTRLAVGDNYLSGMTENCFFVVSSANIRFAGNTVRDVRFYGFNIFGTCQNIGIIDNRVFDVSQGAQGSYDGAVIGTGASNIRIVGNVFRTNAGKPRPRYALNIQSGVTGVVRFGNDLRANPVTGGLVDASTSPVTTSADITA